MNKTSKNSAATAGEIRAILGPVNDDLVIAILQTGAARNDVMQASTWLETGEYHLTGTRNARDVVMRVHEILMADRDKFLPDD